ncbi:gas vesicle protein GvpO [Kribbella sp. NPDC026611]|uniref:gas vesicle protein GvpO n=1 Tax=Kribbella sp. NPDC026611 TaxID=3154911 RepID=UPI0033E5F0AE
MATPRKTTSPRKTAASTPRKRAPSAAKKATTKATTKATAAKSSTARKTTTAKTSAAKKTAADQTSAPEENSVAGKSVPMRQVVLQAASELRDLIGRQPEGVVAVEHLDDGHWKVQIEVIESHRIPETTDILAVYELTADSDGALLSYRRMSRYVRGKFEE